MFAMRSYWVLNNSASVSITNKNYVLPSKNKVDLSKKHMDGTLKKRHTMSYNA